MTLLGFTRPANKLTESIAEAEAMGFEVLAAPSLDIIPGDVSEFERMRSSVTDNSVVVFCSPTAVDQCVSNFGDAFPDMMKHSRAIPIGTATSRCLKDAGIDPDEVPEDFSSSGVVHALCDDVEGCRVVLVRSDSSSDILSDGLRDAGADIVDIESYRLIESVIGPEQVTMMDALAEGRMDALAFTSPRSAESFIGRMEDRFGNDYRNLLGRVRLAAIGGPTSRKLTALGFPVHLVPPRSTFTDLLNAIRDELS